MLSKNQISDYERDGFLVLRQQISEADIQRLERGLERNPPLDGTLYDATRLTYPEPAREFGQPRNVSRMALLL